jgi:hypothetical protein
MIDAGDGLRSTPEDGTAASQRWQQRLQEIADANLSLERTTDLEPKKPTDIGLPDLYDRGFGVPPR